MKKFRKVLDGLTTSSPGPPGSPSCGSAAGTPTGPTPRDIDVQETLVSENFQICKVSCGRLRFTNHASHIKMSVTHDTRDGKSAFGPVWTLFHLVCSATLVHSLAPENKMDR